MPVLDVNAPYDSLATVTSLTRTILADYIAGLQPNLSGVVNASGLLVTWVSGNTFTYLLNGQPMVIGGTAYPVAQVNSPTTLTLLNSAGAQTAVAYSAVIPTGDVFADSQAYVLPTVNLAWRKLQEQLESASHPRMRNETVLYQIPVVASLDPAVQQFINWSNFFDGVNLLSPDTTFGLPTLPQDFMAPLEIWERRSLGNASVVNMNGFHEMKPTVGHLAAIGKGSSNNTWDWREDALYVRGAILPTDWRVSYRAYLPDIVPVTEGFFLTPVPIMRCARALSYYCAAEFVEPRGGTLAQSFTMQGDAATEMINNREGKVLQFSTIRRRAVYNSARRGY